MPPDSSPDHFARLGAALAERYTLVRELGHGGMATVYLARDARHDRDVAIKVMRPELAAMMGAERFLTEIKTTAHLQHPHILSLFDSGTIDGTVFYVMPFVDGESLRDRLARERQLPIDDALRIAREVADALEYAHRQGVIHRDIKPENILLHGGHALVADFGIALAASRTGGERMTETGMSLGTPHYMSPEQAMGERELDARADVYALGCVLFEMLAGEPPFTGPTAQAIVAKVITEGAPSVRSRRPSVPEHVDEAIAVALEKLPADRFRSAEAFAAALTAPSGTMHSARRAAGISGRRPSRGRMIALGAIGALAVAGAFALGRRVSSGSGAAPLVFGRALHVTWDQALEITPVPSPDGKSVAYASGPLTNLHVMVRPVSGGRALALTGDTTTRESYPQWSPDGTRVLFLARGGVHSAPAGGGPPRPEIPPDAGSPVLAATWSPDGKRLGFARGDTLFVRESDASVHAIARMPEPTLCSWSPHGTFIACSIGNALYSIPGVVFGNRAPSRVVLCRVRDGALTTVTDSLSLNTSPTWSPDERWLYFLSDRDGSRDVYGTRVTSDGHADGAAVRLTTGLGAHTIALSADGSRLAYSRLGIRSSIWSMPMPDGPPVATTNAIRLTDANATIEIFDVSPDGKWLFYDTDLTGNSDIFRVAIAGGEPEQLTSDPSDDFAPTPSPDGKEVAFHSWRSGNRDIYVMRLDGGGVQQVTHSPRQEAVPTWSPDGRALTFSDLATGNGVWIARRDASGHWGEAVRRTLHGSRPSWSPDGRSIAYLEGAQGGSVFVVPIDSGEPRMVVDASVPGQSAASLVWGAGGLLYYETLDPRGNGIVWSIAAGGGAPREIIRTDPALHPPSRGWFHVNRGRFYFLSESRESDVWVMEVKGK
jgi:Tol biopolymer transport system component